MQYTICEKFTIHAIKIPKTRTVLNTRLIPISTRGRGGGGGFISTTSNSLLVSLISFHFLYAPKKWGEGEGTTG